MKRSEMIKLLQNYVYDATDGNVIISPDESKLLLGFIEKAGMLPPGLNHNGDGESLDYEWEPEDETT